MSKNIQLGIANPCHEKWDDMTPAEKGRFCASCQKQVIDFTGMSDSQLAAFFKKPSASSVCGHFYEDQLERDIEIPAKRIPWVKYFFQFTLPAFLLSMKAGAQSNIKMGKPIVTVPAKRTTNSRRNPDLPISTTPVQIPQIPKDSLPIPIPADPGKKDVSCFPSEERIAMDGMIGFPILGHSGTVVNEKGKRIAHASLKLDDIPYPIYTDKRGMFFLPWKLKDSDSVVVYASKRGYQEKKTVFYKKDLDSSLTILLEPFRNNKKNETETREEILFTPPTKQQSVTGNFTSFRLSPYPIQRGGIIYIELNSERDEEMQLNVFTLEGAQLLQQSKKIIKGYNQFSLTADSKWAAGIYLVQLRNQQGTVIKQEKLVIQ